MTIQLKQPQYYIKTNDKIVGPFPWDRIAQMREKGRLSSDVGISEDTVTWFSIADAQALIEQGASLTAEKKSSISSEEEQKLLLTLKIVPESAEPMNGSHNPFCTNCGKEIAATASVCPHCEQPVLTAKNYCANCGQPVNSQRSICERCGCRLVQLYRPVVEVRERKAIEPSGQSATTASVFSCLITGLGQIYLGQVFKGLFLLVLAIVIVFFGGYVLGNYYRLISVPYWLLMIVDAGRIGKKLESGQSVGRWEFF